jgi:4-amino-4-deoxy-L-arabinose transferase-like glycosyltransferase
MDEGMPTAEQTGLRRGGSPWRRDVLLLVGLQLLLGVPLLSRVPSYYVDEAWESALGYNLAQTGSLRHPFMEGLGGVHIHFVQNRVVLPLVSAAVFKVVDYGVSSSRIGSLIFGVLAVVSLYGATSRWFGRRQAFWIAVAVMFHPWFFDISRRARPEIYYTSLLLVFLWLLVLYFDSGSRRAAFFSGVFAALAGLAHPNGVILVFSMGCSAIVWLRGKSTGRLILWAAAGLMLTVLPWAIYVVWAIQDPQVSFIDQMHANLLMHTSVLHKEIVRWKTFLRWPKGAGLGVIMFVSWVLAWYRSTRAEKMLATTIGLFVLILPFLSVHAQTRYLSAIVPLFGALIVRLVWRSTAAVGGVRRQIWGRVRVVLGIGAAAVYLLTNIAATGLMFYYSREADLSKVIDGVASAVSPESRVYGCWVFWMGHKRYQYGPFTVTRKWHERMTLAEGMELVRKHRFDYAVKTAWVGIPEGVLWAPRSMPGFRDHCLVDHICKRFGTKVDEFYDPYFGPIEIYRLDWDGPPPYRGQPKWKGSFEQKNLNVDVVELSKMNPAVENIAALAREKHVGKFGKAVLRRVTVWETDKTYCSYCGA